MFGGGSCSSLMDTMQKQKDGEKRPFQSPSLFDVKLIQSLFPLSLFLFKPLSHSLSLLDDVNAIVIDIGSATVKAGYAGEDAPKAVYPSVRKREKRQGSLIDYFDVTSCSSPSPPPFAPPPSRHASDEALLAHRGS